MFRNKGLLMGEAEPIRVALVDDHSIVRRGLGAVLITTDQLELVGEAEDGQEAIELCERTQPDIVLMDLIMPRMDGIEATRTIHQRWPDIQVLVLTSFTEQEMIQGALDAGARGYLLKNVKGRELVDAIIQIHQGGQTIAQEAKQTLHLSEQLSILEEELNRDGISTANIAESLNRHLPNLFTNYQIQVRLFPDQELYITPSQIIAPIPDQGWEWLEASGEEKIVFQGGELPWGGIQTWGQVMMLTPVQGKDQILGGIGLLSGDTAPDIDDLAKISSSLAEILASAIDRKRISNQRLSRKQSADELQMAGKLQSRILPENPPRLDGWDIASQLVPARETTGDFYDFIPLDNDKWGILIADVTDKGLGAAVFMAMCSALIRTYAIRFPTLPALALSSVNERIFIDMRGGLFLTAFYGVLEPQTGRLRYVNAGHNPPMLLSEKKGRLVDKLKHTGMALGISEGATWQQMMITLSPGDVLVMYTDGITEAHNKDGDFFSEPRLQAAISNQREPPAADTLEALLEEIDAFTDGAPGQDDLALVVLSRER
jgi:serine phosphatase RsbU (regulator of sigma subunit)/DNA-binding NarL/FixJ family response regulator